MWVRNNSETHLVKTRSFIAQASPESQKKKKNAENKRRVK